MTVPTTISRADYTGNGVTTAWSVPFYFLDQTHLLVIRTQISTGIATTLALTTDYTVTGAGVPAGGTVTTVVLLTPDQRISILRNVPLTQLAHYVPNDPFPAATHEMIVDQLTMEAQQLSEAQGRALTLSPNSSGVSTVLPIPIGSNLIGWNSAATALTSVSVSSLATAIVANTWLVDKFDGTGAQTAFTLTSPPGNINAVLCSVSGVVQVPGVNFSLASNVLTFLTGAPAAGTNNVVVQYGQAVQTVGAADMSNVINVLAVTNGGTGASSLAGLNAQITAPTALASVNSGQIAGVRNRVMNGGFDSWSAGTSISSGSAVYTTIADNWLAYASGTAVTVSRNAGGGYTAGTDALTLTGAASNTYIDIRQRFEARNVQKWKNGNVTVSARFYNNTGSTITSNSLIFTVSTPTVTDNWAGSSQQLGTTFTHAAIPTASWGYLTVTFNPSSYTDISKGMDIGLRVTALGAGQAVVWSEVQLEVGSQASVFEQTILGAIPPGATVPGAQLTGNIAAAQLTGNIAAARMSAAFTANNSTNGYVTLPNGTLLQWGRVTHGVNDASTVAISFPITFPNGVFSVVASESGSLPPAFIMVGTPTTSGTTFTALNRASGVTIGTGPIHWFAIGY